MSSNSLETAKDCSAKWWRPVLLMVAILAAIILARDFGLVHRLVTMKSWIASLGAWGPLVFVLLYAAGVVAAIPGSILTVVAGALFGSIYGVMLVSVASTLGAALAFLIARYFARESVTRWLFQYEKFRRLYQLTSKRGAIIVGLTRLVPIFPFVMLNYGFGLTAISFWTYLFWSWLCMLPGTVLYVVGTAALVNGFSSGGISWMLILVIFLSAILLTVSIRYARRRLGENDIESDPNESL